MHFRPFPVFLAYVFLSGKSADPTPPPLLVENSTNFFKPSLSRLGIRRIQFMTDTDTD